MSKITEFENDLANLVREQFSRLDLAELREFYKNVTLVQVIQDILD